MGQIIRMLSIAVIAAGSAAASSAQVSLHLSSATIKGDYAFRVSGEVFTGAGIVYRDGIALTHFDGDHSLTQNDYVLANGVPVPGPRASNGFYSDEAGAYSVNDDCTGEAEIDFPAPRWRNQRRGDQDLLHHLRAIVSKYWTTGWPS